MESSERMSFRAYAEEMATSKHWGGALEIASFAALKGELLPNGILPPGSALDLWARSLCIVIS